jgi:predicted nucleic acid-binding protein
MYIVIDTNAVNNDLLLKHPAIKKLVQKALEQGYQICFPEVVIEEMHKHFRQNTDNAVKGLRKSAKIFDDMSGVNTLDEDGIKKCESASKKYRRTIRSTIEASGGKILGEPKISKRQLMNKAVGRIKPFHESGKGYQDALIWANVIDLAKQYAGMSSITEARIIFVTNNTTDF